MRAQAFQNKDQAGALQFGSSQTTGAENSAGSGGRTFRGSKLGGNIGAGGSEVLLSLHLLLFHALP